MTKIAVVHYIGATERSRSVVCSLLADLVAEGHEVTLLDISAFSIINQDLPSPLVARLLGHRVFTGKFESALAELGVHHLLLTPGVAARTEIAGDSWGGAEQAIESELLTYFRQPSLDPSSRAMKTMRQQLTTMALSAFDSLSEVFHNSSPDLVVIPNGRTSRQKVARIAAEQRGIDVRFYENARAKRDSYYLGKTQPHDRLASQEEVKQLVSALPKKEISQMAQEWLSERMSPSSGTNTFSGLWAPPSDTKEEKANLAVFFTSSADEFLAFGPMWNIDSWSWQFEAFDCVMSILESKGINLRLRIHPNLTGKSRTYFRETLRNVATLQQKHPGLIVDLPHSSVNSYELAQQANYVIAERSTIGLEANLMGKPVWINQASQWDLTADIRQFLALPDITSEALEPWTVNTHGAEQFVAYWMLQEKPLRYSWKDWSTWNPDKAPWRMKLARLSVRNPWHHRVHLLRLEAERWLNSRTKS